MEIAAVIPVRNRPTLIGEAIASIQRQTLPVREIIVIDDGSTDDTPAQVEALAAADLRIRLVRRATCQGASAARNEGVRIAAAEWIAFLDSDDEWHPEKLARQAAGLADQPEAVASFTGIRYIHPKGDFEVPPPKDVGLRELRRFNILGSTSTALVRRDAFLRSGGFDPSLPSCQDWDLWLKLVRLGPFVVLPEPLLFYAYGGHARISNRKDAVLKGHETIFRQILSEVRGLGERRHVRAYHHARLAQIYLWDFGERRPAFAAALRSLALRPTHQGVAILKAVLDAYWPRSVSA